MNQQFDVGEAYEKDRYPINENGILWMGVGLLLVFAIMDWELFQWLFVKLHVKY